MGPRAALPLKRRSSRSAATLAPALQPRQKPQRDRQPAAHHPRSQPAEAEQLDGADADGLGALGPGLGAVLDPRALGERAEAVGLDVGVVDEEVLARLVRRDEAEALLIAEPLHDALCHVSLPTCSVLPTREALPPTTATPTRCSVAGSRRSPALSRGTVATWRAGGKGFPPARWFVHSDCEKALGHAIGRVAVPADQAAGELGAAEVQRRVVLPRRADAAVHVDV